jgi:biopolymer transport protein ExbB/TolQ
MSYSPFVDPLVGFLLFLFLFGVACVIALLVLSVYSIVSLIREAWQKRLKKT